MPTNKPRVQVTLKQSTYDYICEFAEHEKISKSDVINIIIKDFLDSKNNRLAAEEQLLVNAYRYGTKEEREILWKAWGKVDEIAFNRRKNEQNKIINIGRDNNGNINL